jgi:hypothetical protein
MTPSRVSAGCLLALLCAAGRTVAQPAGGEVPPAASAASPPAAPAPAPPPEVQHFAPADVVEPKAAPPSSASPKAEAGAMPLTMDEMPVAATSNRVTVNFFGDPAFVIDSQHKTTPGFILNPLDFLITGRSGGLIAMTEFAMEQIDGVVGIDIERLFVGWHAERYQIDAGRTHAELGYWNNAFHHGRWLQLPIERPRIVRFEDEGGILPIHWVGVTGHWRPLLQGDQQVEVSGSIGNGHGAIVDNILTEGDTNGFKAILGKVEVKGFGARDLRLGISATYDQIGGLPAAAPMGGFARPALPDTMIREVIGNAYLAYRGPELTVISEVYEVMHSAPGATGGPWNTFDAFALGGYRFGDLVPYVLAEIRRTPTDPDPFFFPDPTMASAIFKDFEEITAGLRWDLTTWSALKLEYRDTMTADTSLRVHRGMIDWSFGL